MHRHLHRCRHRRGGRSMVDTGARHTAAAPSRVVGRRRAPCCARLGRALGWPLDQRPALACTHRTPAWGGCWTVPGCSAQPTTPFRIANHIVLCEITPFPHFNLDLLLIILYTYNVSAYIRPKRLHRHFSSR
jgi:hypothetical protein